MTNIGKVKIFRRYLGCWDWQIIVGQVSIMTNRSTGYKTEQKAKQGVQRAAKRLNIELIEEDGQ